MRAWSKTRNCNNPGHLGLDHVDARSGLAIHRWKGNGVTFKHVKKSSKNIEITRYGEVVQCTRYERFHWNNNYTISKNLVISIFFYGSWTCGKVTPLPCYSFNPNYLRRY